MSDVFGSAPQPEPTPAPAPAPAEAPARTEFDMQLDDFLGRDLLAEMTEPPAPPASPAAQPAAQSAPAPQPVGVSGSPAPAAAGAPPSPQPAPGNVGSTPAPATTQPAPVDASTSPEVDPNLVLRMLAPNAAPAASASAPAPAPASAPAAPAASAAADEIPAPFTANMGIPPALLDTIFNSEDPNQRQQALGALMAALGNAVVGYVEERVIKHHSPRLVEQFQTAAALREQQAAVGRDFYGRHPDLEPYRDFVLRAGEVYMQNNPNAVYDEPTREAIAALARTALKQLGHNVGQPAPAASAAPAAAPAAPAPVAAPRMPYMAGGATPGGPLETPTDPNGPADIFDQMTGGFL